MSNAASGTRDGKIKFGIDLGGTKIEGVALGPDRRRVVPASQTDSAR